MNAEVSQSTFNLLVASRLPGIGKASLRQIAADPDFYRTPLEELCDLHPGLRALKDRSQRFTAADSWARDQIDKASASGMRIFGFWDSQYPALMRASVGSPAIFWYRGSEEALQAASVTVIGTREPTPAGQVSARRISAALGLEGICVVSGLALGVDALAHEACIEVGGRTVAVMAGGLENISPKRNMRLAEAILDTGGGLLSEFPIGAPAMPTNFVTRDTTQAALGSAVILVQTDRSGGSLHASRAIIKMRRPLYVVAPFELDITRREPKIQGNLALLSGDAGEVASMDFSRDFANFVVPLRSREDYPSLFQAVRVAWEKAKPVRRV